MLCPIHAFRHIYSNVFDWLVGVINNTLMPSKEVRGNFDIVSVHVSRLSQRYTRNPPPHTHTDIA